MSSSWEQEELRSTYLDHYVHSQHRVSKEKPEYVLNWCCTTVWQEIKTNKRAK